MEFDDRDNVNEMQTLFITVMFCNQIAIARLENFFCHVYRQCDRNCKALSQVPH